MSKFSLSDIFRVQVTSRLREILLTRPDLEGQKIPVFCHRFAFESATPYLPNSTGQILRSHTPRCD